MGAKQENEPGQLREPHAAQVETDSSQSHTPRRLTFIENMLLTAKVLAGFALLGAVLWALNSWTAAN